MKKKQLLFLIIFIILGLIFLVIPFTNIVGSNQKFSLFDFFAPATGLFIGSIWGAVSVVFVKVISFLFSGQPLDTSTIIRFFPLALAALYFGARKYQKLVAVIPLLCMVLFILHPEGRGAWFYSLYWLIPVAAVFIKRSLIFNSLGATFTAHAVGSVAFLYAFNLPTETWIALIPIVFLERMLFTGGIAVSYLVMNSLLNWMANKLRLPVLQKLVNPNYVFSKKLILKYL